MDPGQVDEWSRYTRESESVYKGQRSDEHGLLRCLGRATGDYAASSVLVSVRGGAWTDVRNQTFKNERKKMPEKEWGEEENEARLVKRIENSRRKKSTVSTASERRKNWP